MTDNGPEDGCVVAVPGSHKNNIDIDWASYKNYQMPGALAITGKAGDVFLFSEAVMHNGLPKTTEGLRTNLYFNYVTPDMDVFANRACQRPSFSGAARRARALLARSKSRHALGGKKPAN